MFSKILKIVLARKMISIFTAIVFVVAGYFVYGYFKGDFAEARYILAEVKRGTLVSSVSGSGQVSAASQIELKSKAGGEVVYIGVRNGEEARAGTLLMRLDANDAEKAVRDAELNLESAKLNLLKLKGESEFAISRVVEKAEDNLKKSYDDGFNIVSNVFLDLPEIMSGLQGILYDSDLNGSQANINFYSDAVKNYNEKASLHFSSVADSYKKSRSSYEKTFEYYKTASRYSDEKAIENLINESYFATQSIAETIKNSNNLIRFYQDELSERNIKPNFLSAAHLSSLNSYTEKTNRHLLALLDAINSIKNGKDALKNAGLDVETQELAVKQKENALKDAKEKLNDYFIYAPFGGIAAKIDVEKGDDIAANSTLGMFITKNHIAEIILNEVDIAGVKIGNKVEIEFDALPDLKMYGLVAEIDSIGTVSQGVVSYAVKINIDVKDDRIKPGMSISANIITDSKSDVLMVPNSAVKSQGEEYFVKVVGNEYSGKKFTAAISGVALKNAPENKTVKIGFSNDQFTELISGLGEGDVVVVRTIRVETMPSQAAPSIFGGGGGARNSGGGRGFVR